MLIGPTVRLIGAQSFIFDYAHGFGAFIICDVMSEIQLLVILTPLVSLKDTQLLILKRLTEAQFRCVG